MIEVSVAGKQRRLVPPGDGGDHAVDQSAGRDAGLPAPAVDTHGPVVVCPLPWAEPVTPLLTEAGIRGFQCGFRAPIRLEFTWPVWVFGAGVVTQFAAG